MKKTFLILLILSCFQNGFAQNTLSYTDIESHYNNGVELFEKKAYTAARKEFRAYIEKSASRLTPDKFTISNAEYYSAVCGLYTNALDADIEIQRFVLHHSEHPKAKIIYSDLGNSFYEKGDYKKAIEYLTKAIANRGDNLEVYDLRYKLGVSYYQLKDFKNALVEFNFVKKTASENALDAAYYAAVINFQNEDYDAALFDLRRVENVNPYKLEVPNWIAQILFKQKKYDELLAYAEPIIQKPEGRKIDDICLVAAEVQYFNNNFEKAAAYYDKFRELRRGQSDPQVAFRHGFSLYKSEQFAHAIVILKQVADKNNEIGQQAAYYLGISALKTGDLNSALAAFDFARKSDFDKEIKEEAHYNYVKVLLETGQNELAITSLKDYVKQYPAGKYVDQTNELLSDILFETNDYKNAIVYIESLSRTTAKINEAYQKLAYAQAVNNYNSEDYKSATIYFNKSLSKPINNELVQNALYWKAETAYATNADNVESLYREVLQKGTTSQRNKSLYSLAYLSYNKREFSEALTYFKDFLNAASNDQTTQQIREDALLRLADCYLIQKDFKNALVNYDKALSQNRSDKDYALYQKGVTLDFLGRKEEAAKVFDSFTRLYENSRLIDDALFQRGNLEMDEHKYQNAIATFSEMLRKRPKSTLVPDALLKRALAYGNLQNYDAATADYKMIIDKFGNSEVANEALIGLRDIMNSTGRSEDFAGIADEYQKNNPKSSSALALQYEAARNLYYTEKYEAAIGALQRFIAANPNNSNVTEAQFLIGESYYFTDRSAQALPYFKQVVEKGQSLFLTRASFRAADIAFAAKDYRSAVTDYQNVLSSGGTKRDEVLAWEGLFMSYFELGDYDNCVKYCNEVINNSAGVVAGINNKAELFIGKCYWKRRSFEAANTQLNRVIALGKDVNGAEASYIQGLMLNEAGKYEDAIKKMQEHAASFSDFLEWYEKGFLLIADSYIGLKDFFMAKATLNSIIENSETPETLRVAKEKLKSIPNN